jgi:hypothetical protein
MLWSHENVQQHSPIEVAAVEGPSVRCATDYRKTYSSATKLLASGRVYQAACCDGYVRRCFFTRFFWHSSWKDSVFILTHDESGGFYDHVAPQPTVSPDGVKPMDLLQGPPPNGPDICVLSTGPTCDFTYTGYRVPLIVISPFSKKNYVSHTVADYTAWLKLVETVFGVPSLTKRDAAQMDMTEFFDFANAPWRTPPTPPVQPTSGSCYLDKLP